MQGNIIVAQCFAQQQIKHCFGVIGVPVIELGYALQAHGIEYFGFRNEQAASYAASGVGYLTQRPGLCLVVSGPGLIHALAGAANAQTNGWPMVILAGSSDLGQIGQGSFQEYDQVSLVRPYVKFAARITDLRLAPQLVEQAVRISMVGRPGCTYIEVPGDILRQTINSNLIRFPEPFTIERLPICQAVDSQVREAVYLLQSAQNPLIIIGKGCAMSRAEQVIRDYVNYTGLPFLPTPMGKGVVPDSHECNVSPARSTAIGQADVVLLLGARLNWILHFGLPPRFNKNVKIIHVDINPEEFDTNVQSSVNLYGDIKSVVAQLLSQTKQMKWVYSSQSVWWSTLKKKIVENKAANHELINDMSLPLQYYSSIGIVSKYLPVDCVVIGEGSNTMDIGRTIIQHQNPRLKMDSGTFATMGLGMGFCIAAKLVYPEKQVFAVVGDSAFGFSAMELETATRYNLHIVVIIINNNGIFMGVDEIPKNNADIPVTALNPSTAYEKLGEALGAKGFLITTHEALHSAMKEVISQPNKSYVLNVKISSSGQKKPQEHSWLTQSKL